MDNNSKIYLQPEIIRVNLDNEISLALQSAPPEGPGETGINQLNASDQYNQMSPLA
jgi:hypothetical protein